MFVSSETFVLDVFTQVYMAKIAEQAERYDGNNKRMGVVLLR